METEYITPGVAQADAQSDAGERMSRLRIGKVKEWHQPRNEDCHHNFSADLDCNCKRPRNRKPYRAVRVHDEGVGRRVNPNIILEIYHNGAIALREQRRSKRYWTTAADIYSWRIWQEGLKAAAERRQRRKERKMQKRKTRKFVG